MYFDELLVNGQWTMDHSLWAREGHEAVTSSVIYVSIKMGCTTQIRTELKAIKGN